MRELRREANAQELNMSLGTVFQASLLEEANRPEWFTESTLLDTLRVVALKKQVHIVGEATYSEYGHYHNRAKRLGLTEQAHEPVHYDKPVQIFGGTILAVDEPTEVVWVGYYRPSEIDSHVPYSSHFVFGFHLGGVSLFDTISFDPLLGRALAEGEQIMPRNKPDESPYKKALDLQERIINSNIFLHGDPFDPRGRSDAGYGAPC